MTLNSIDARTLAQAGLDALRRGDGAIARAAFERLLADAPADTPRPWLPLAQACRLTGDAAAETAALSALLDVDPRNLPALLLMGDRKRLDGDDRAANSFYTAALRQAQAMGTGVPPALRQMLDDAQRHVGEATRAFERHLDAAVDDAPATPRLGQAIDLLMGRRELYVQQPSMFYLPELAQRAFFDRAEFDWVPALEAATPAIRAELEALDADDAGFHPYVSGSSDRPRPNNPLLDNRDWSAFDLWKGGAPVATNAARCPATMAALADLPIPRIAGRSPMALFSRLRPGTHIRPHHGLLNTRLICHLPLIVPDGCGLRVGSETREWREGELMVFDDSFEHEAWNRGTETRTVLLFEIWRPDVSAGERDQLRRLFEAIDRYGGAVAVDH